MNPNPPSACRVVQKNKDFKDNDGGSEDSNVDEHSQGGEGKWLLTTRQAVPVRVVGLSHVSVSLRLP